ncbi:helix-turn-helix domain-containing protein [Pseudomonas syringae pv. syringae]|uniref:LexA family protein n=1 Tax=Pseudomonas syringae group TaxID=136849 RepID=UPI0011874365|nr:MULTISPECIES: S24 family peptidase [Pseudomonas syringae group]MCK9740050.1 helix-turn-helix domain-containing protein [Pseudomonas syringae pv. syringae]
MDTAGRLRAKMAEHGLNESQLGRRAGVPQPTINRILSGESSSPRRPTVEKIAKALKVSPDWLMFGTGEDKFDSNVEAATGPSRYFEYPEISWVQAGVAAEAMDLFSVGDFEAMHPSDAWAGPNGFWLKVKGPSMTSSNGMSFSEGMLILVAPGGDVESGQYVVAKLIDTNEATFKQFIWDSGKAYLKPLNPAFPTVEVDNAWSVVGRVIDAKWPRSVL